MHSFFARRAPLRRAFVAPLPLVGLLAAVGPLVLAGGSVDTPAHRAEIAYRSLPELPEGSADRSAAGVEASAIALAASLRAVPIDALGAECARADLTVSWDEPDPSFEVGAHVTPLGPAPTEATTSVNGIVLCHGFDYGYMGFEAEWSVDHWDVVAVPFVGEGEEDHLVAQPAPVIPQGPKPIPVLAAPGTVTGPIEGYAAYEPQRTCDASPKVGTRSLAGALLRDYPVSRNLGIVRGCGVGGRSEHKEGRAFDWGVNITNPGEKAAAESFIAALLATDAAGNPDALARRIGVMYIIWNRQIWSSYRVKEGWRPYSGASSHRDHVHISLSWAGALGRTSFWSGTVPPDLLVASPNTSTVAASRSVSSNRSGSHRTGNGPHNVPTGQIPGRGGGHHHDDGSSSGHLSRDEIRDGIRALSPGGRPPTEAAVHDWLVSVGVPEADAARYAAWAARHLGHHDAPDPEEQDPGGDEAVEHDDAEQQHNDREAERAARQEARRQAKEQRWAEEQARRAGEQQRRAEEQARRHAENEARREQQPPADQGQHAGGGGRHRGWGDGRHGGGHGPTTTVPPTTTTTVAPTTTTVEETTTTTTGG